LLQFASLDLPVQALHYRQPSKQDVPPPKVAQPSLQNNSGASRSAPPLIVTTEVPTDAEAIDWLSTNAFDKEMDRAEKRGFYPARIEGRYQDGITQYRAFLKLKDASIYSYNCYRDFEEWRYNEEHEYYERSYQYVTTGYSKIIENHQSYSGPKGERHQMVYIVIK